MMKKKKKLQKKSEVKIFFFVLTIYQKNTSKENALTEKTFKKI